MVMDIWDRLARLTERSSLNPVFTARFVLSVLVSLVMIVDHVILELSFPDVDACVTELLGTLSFSIVCIDA